MKLYVYILLITALGFISCSESSNDSDNANENIQSEQVKDSSSSIREKEVSYLDPNDVLNALDSILRSGDVILAKIADSGVHTQIMNELNSVYNFGGLVIKNKGSSPAIYQIDDVINQTKVIDFSVGSKFETLEIWRYPELSKIVTPEDIENTKQVLYDYLLLPLDKNVSLDDDAFYLSEYIFKVYLNGPGISLVDTTGLTKIAPEDLIKGGKLEKIYESSIHR